MSEPIRDDPITDAEEALFQRLLRRLSDVKQSAAADVAESAAAKVSYAAGAVGKVAGDAAGQIADYAKSAADSCRISCVLAVGAIGPAAPVALLAITALTARKIVQSRRSGKEPIAQLLFRVPEGLRDEVKRTRAG